MRCIIHSSHSWWFVLNVINAQACGVELDCLAFIVSDAGAMLWHVVVEEGERGDTVTLECDDDYERHVDYRWDAHVAKQVGSRL